MHYLLAAVLTVCLLSFGAPVVQAAQNEGSAPVPPASIGDRAPDFTLLDADGKEVALSDFAGRAVVLEWTNPECPCVGLHYEVGTMKRVAEKYAPKVIWLAINTTRNTTAEENRAWRAKHQLPYPILLDPTGEVGMRYGARTTPHLFIISPEGKIVYRGAIDDDYSGEGKAVRNYIEEALDELLAGKTITTPETRPYGCRVKYRSQMLPPESNSVP